MRRGLRPSQSRFDPLPIQIRRGGGLTTNEIFLDPSGLPADLPDLPAGRLDSLRIP